MSSAHSLASASAFPAQDFLETLPMAVYVCDSPSGAIRRYNRAARELWGEAPRPGTQLCGAMRLFLPDGTPLPVEQCPMAFAVREGKAYADQYVLMQRVDGRRFIANVNIAPLRNPDGRLIGAINAFQDVTARRRTEMLLEAQRLLLEKILGGEPVEKVLADAAGAAERFALYQAHVLIYLAEPGHLRLAVARGAPQRMERLPLAPGTPALQALPAHLPLEQDARLAYATPLQDAKGALLGVLALYEPAGTPGQAAGHADLELLARTAALALERRALIEAEARALRIRDDSMRVAREAEAAARATAERFRLLLEGLPAAAYTCDAQGRITYFNRRAVELWGREPRLNDPQDLYCGSYKLYLGEGQPIAHDQCWMARALHEGQRYEGREVRIERPDGSVVTALAHAMPFHDERGALSGAVNVLVDITERAAAEKTVRASEEWLRAIVETTPECVKLVAPDGTLLQMNASGLAMVGAAQAADVLGKSVYDIIAPEHRATFIAFNERICSGERGHLEFDIVGLGGVRRHMETHAAPLADAQGRLLQLAVTRDVTERRRTEAERERFAAQLAESDRRKDEFIAMLSHELRNPLAPLKTSVDLLAAARRDPSIPLDKVQPIMARQVDHLVRLVDDLLEAARITRGTLELRSERIALESVVRQSLETSRPAIDDAGHELRVELPEEPLWVDGDSVRLVQILSNLLNNAAKYTDPKGRIEVRVRREGAHAAVVVRDNGIGLPPELAPRLFEMFARSDSDAPRGRSGLGVGLALARRLAEMHGGTLVARSDGPGKGSEFELRLPLAQPAAAAAPAPAAAQGSGAAGERVLVVDDNRDGADTLVLLLGTLGVQARAVNDGAEALAVVEDYAPALVLLDIGMPGMDGYAVARAMRTRLRRPPLLVALTGWGQVHDRERAAAAGFDHHLVKPARVEDLQSLLARAREAQRAAA